MKICPPATAIIRSIYEGVTFHRHPLRQFTRRAAGSIAALLLFRRPPNVLRLRRVLFRAIKSRERRFPERRRIIDTINDRGDR